MKVIFFKVEGLLNFPDSDAVAPSGAKGVAESCVKDLKKIVQSSGARLVLIGEWKTSWNFDDAKCTPDGAYLNKKLDRRGLHILDKTKDDLPDIDGVSDWLQRHPNVTEYCILDRMEEVNWKEW